MRAIRPATIALTLCLAACGTPMESNGVGDDKAAAAAAGTDISAAAGNGAAETPVGHCPFATGGWEATISPAFQPGEEPSVALNGEARPDKDGRMPMLFALGVRRPPLLVLELSSDSMVEPQADRGWMGVGAVFEDYDPKYTHAAISCAGLEIARVPIRPEP